MKRKSRVFLLSLILTFGCILCLIYHKDSLSHITSTQLVKSFNFKNINEYQVNNSKDLDLEIPLNPNNNGNSFSISLNLNNSLNKEIDTLISLYEKNTNKLIYAKLFNIIKGESVLLPKIFYDNNDKSYILKIKAENKEIFNDIKIVQNGVTLKFINSLCYIFQALLYTVILGSLIFFLYSYRSKIFNLKNISIFSLTNAVVLILFGYIYNSFHWDVVNVPFFLDGIDDGHFLSVAKNAIDGNSFWYMNDLGAPFGVARYNFPMLMAFYYDFCYFLGFFTSNVILVNNLYYILTFLFAVFGFILIARELKINYYLALFGGLLFSFTQYHLFRSAQHVTASSYFVITLIFYFCINIVFKDNFNNRKLEIEDKIKLYSSLILSSFFIGSVDIYYAYFGCAFIVLSILIALFNKRLVACLRGLYFLFMIFVVLISNLYPSILNSILNGSTKTSARDPYEAFYYGLSLVHLFMPKTFGDFHIFSWLTQAYNHSKFFKTEAIINYLGIMGIIGFIILIAVLLIDGFRKFIQKYEDDDNKEMLNFLSKLNIFALLLGLQSAVGVFIALFGFTKIRTYNRISVYILMFSILAVIYLINILFKKYFKNFKQIYIVIFCIVLLCFHVNENNLRKFPQNYNTINNKISSIKEFALNVNNYLKNGAKVLQLPILTYPENYVSQNLVNCNYQVFPYLFTKNIQWSFGTLSHTNEYFYQKNMFGLEDIMSDLINAKNTGFDGITINTDIFDKARISEESKILDDVKEILGNPIFVSKDKKIYFFDFNNFKNFKDNNIENVNFIADKLYLNEGWADMWSAKEIKNRWALVKNDKKKAQDKNKGGSSYINFISCKKSPYKIIIKVLSPINNHLKVYLNNNIIGDFSVTKGKNVFETKYIYEDSSKNLHEINLIKLEHAASFKPSDLFKNNYDHRNLTLNYQEVKLKF